MFVFASQLNGDAAKIFAAMIGVVLLFHDHVVHPDLPDGDQAAQDARRHPPPLQDPGRNEGRLVLRRDLHGGGRFASIVGLFPGLGNGEFLNDQDLSDAYGLSRAGYTSIAFGAIAVTFLVGVWFYIAGAKTRAEMVPSRRVVGTPPPSEGTAPGSRSSRPRATRSGMFCVGAVASAHPHPRRPCAAAACQASIDARTRWMAMRRCCSGMARL